MNCSSLRVSFLFATLAFLASSPLTHAQCPQICDQFNTALGDGALQSNTIGGYNTAVGASVLTSNTLGNYNTAIGYQALYSNTGGIQNTATGSLALFFNTTGYENTANGISTLYFNTTGYGNTATGAAALTLNTIGNDNTATGGGAMNANQTGSHNTATGHLALEITYNGSSNTATGDTALQNNEDGSNNTATGSGALQNNKGSSSNTADGFDALNETSGNNNIALGANAGVALTTGDDNIDIGNEGVAGESGTIRIGTVGTQTATYIAGIRDARIAHGAAVTVGITDDGQLGVRASSARFKEAIKPMDKASEAIFSLQPVTFRYRKDRTAVPQFGLVAEEVAKVNQDLVVTDAEGKPFTVRYEEVNAMLLNEFLKEHHKVQELEATVAKLTAMVEKVSAQLELDKSTPQTVQNNQ